MVGSRYTQRFQKNYLSIQSRHLNKLESLSCTAIRSEFDPITVSKFFLLRLLLQFRCLQAESVRASLAQKNVIVATLTSSGKSLCYNLPVLEELLKDSSSCALYIFPTKVSSFRIGKEASINFSRSICSCKHM